jgi:hypothetical protein
MSDRTSNIVEWVIAVPMLLVAAVAILAFAGLSIFVVVWLVRDAWDPGSYARNLWQDCVLILMLACVVLTWGRVRKMEKRIMQLETALEQITRYSNSG